MTGWTYILRIGREGEEDQREYLERSTPEIGAQGSQVEARVQDLIEGSTPEISTMSSQDAGAEGETGGACDAKEEQMLSEVVYGNRRAHIELSGLGAEEAHTRVREAMGVPEGTNTGLQWEKVGWKAIRFTLTNVWAEQRAWYEEQGIHVRMGQQSAAEREAEQRERVRRQRSKQSSNGSHGNGQKRREGRSRKK
jgi:hypothetical protein